MRMFLLYMPTNSKEPCYNQSISHCVYRVVLIEFISIPFDSKYKKMRRT